MRFCYQVLESIRLLLICFCFGLLALAIDRWGLLASAFGYILNKIDMLIRQEGGVWTNFALTALVIGSVLLLLSAFWHRARAVVVSSLPGERSEEHTSELQSLMRISYAVFCLKKKKK